MNKWFKVGMVIVLALSPLLAEIFLASEPLQGFFSIAFFYAIAAAFASMLLIIISVVVGKMLKRKEDYYKY